MQVIINLSHISAKFICLAHTYTSHSWIKNMAGLPANELSYLPSYNVFVKMPLLE